MRILEVIPDECMKARYDVSKETDADGSCAGRTVAGGSDWSNGVGTASDGGDSAPR